MWTSEMSCFLFDRELNRKQAQGTQEGLQEFHLGMEYKLCNYDLIAIYLFLKERVLKLLEEKGVD